MYSAFHVIEIHYEALAGGLARISTANSNVRQVCVKSGRCHVQTVNL